MTKNTICTSLLNKWTHIHLIVCNYCVVTKRLKITYNRTAQHEHELIFISLIFDMYREEEGQVNEAIYAT